MKFKKIIILTFVMLSGSFINSQDEPENEWIMLSSPQYRSVDKESLEEFEKAYSELFKQFINHVFENLNPEDQLTFASWLREMNNPFRVAVIEQYMQDNKKNNLLDLISHIRGIIEQKKLPEKQKQKLDKLFNVFKKNIAQKMKENKNPFLAIFYRNGSINFNQALKTALKEKDYNSEVYLILNGISLDEDDQYYPMFVAFKAALDDKIKRSIAR